MRNVFAVFLAVFVLGSCAGADPFDHSGLIIDMKNVDYRAYRNDLADCNEYADQVSIGSYAAAGAVGGAAAYAVIGAVVGNSDTAERLAGAGAVLGAAEAAADGYKEQETVLRNCLRERGYKVFN